MSIRVDYKIDNKKLLNPYTFARGKVSEHNLIIVRVIDSTSVGFGECSPYEEFFELPVESVVKDLELVVSKLNDSSTIKSLKKLVSNMPFGPAKCALDCAIWDYESRKEKIHVSEMIGLKKVNPVQIAYTIPIGTVDEAIIQAKNASEFPVIKIKAGCDVDKERIIAIRENAPNSTLVVDPNGGWTLSYLKHAIKTLEDANVSMLEQPLPKGRDAELMEIDTDMKIYADESFSTREDLELCSKYYDGANIKLDKCGGLSEALLLVKLLRNNNLDVMVGCLAGTSLSSAPGLLVAQHADFVDLDSHLWHETDRPGNLEFKNGILKPGDMAFWGTSQENISVSELF
ncbi:hypothetical protein BCT93_22770 [Vibrio lentus]|uniref:dipeptide epimerase n=1 Tax=Vibrio lentus TaxID=136468 RepID=UPI000C848504|nr:dipeptide epimerase [Vibrio lentus]PMK67068.1 hypothetical protein BCT93_22770 [Vibrio lentus]